MGQIHLALFQGFLMLSILLLLLYSYLVVSKRFFYTMSRFHSPESLQHWLERSFKSVSTNSSFAADEATNPKAHCKNQQK
jgi:hypothetical protein